jgi:hypothetical protein
LVCRGRNHRFGGISALHDESLSTVALCPA